MGGALRLIALLVTVLTLVTAGTVFFALVEGWSWLDAYFFTVVTLSTVGYGNIVPVTVAGKIGTTVFIFIGLGIFAVVIQQFGMFAMQKREEHTEWLIARLGHRQSGSHSGSHSGLHGGQHGPAHGHAQTPGPMHAQDQFQAHGHGGEPEAANDPERPDLPHR